MNKMWIAVAAVWISVALAVSVGIYFTHSMHCLWFMLIPTCISFKSSDNKEENE